MNLGTCFGSMSVNSSGLQTVANDLHLEVNNRQPNSGTASGIKLPHAVIVRAPGLLPMRYRPAELAEDLEVPESTLRDWLGMGLPHQRDDRGHIWINGREFAEWVKSSRRSTSGPKMAEDEAYCFCCQKPVKLLNPATTSRGKQHLLKSACPHCGSNIYRGIRSGQSR